MALSQEDLSLLSDYNFKVHKADLRPVVSEDQPGVDAIYPVFTCSKLSDYNDYGEGEKAWELVVWWCVDCPIKELSSAMHDSKRWTYHGHWWVNRRRNYWMLAKDFVVAKVLSDNLLSTDSKLCYKLFELERPGRQLWVRKFLSFAESLSDSSVAPKLSDIDLTLRRPTLTKQVDQTGEDSFYTCGADVLKVVHTCSYGGRWSRWDLVEWWWSHKTFAEDLKDEPEKNMSYHGPWWVDWCGETWIFAANVAAKDPKCSSVFRHADCYARFGHTKFKGFQQPRQFFVNKFLDFLDARGNVL